VKSKTAEDLDRLGPRGKPDHQKSVVQGSGLRGDTERRYLFGGKPMKLLRLLSIGLLLSGCSITQKVDPVPKLSVAEICIIENPDVREGFIETYRRPRIQKISS
jgi:hypothetical protein